MTKILDACNRLVWGVPMLLLIVAVGVYLTARTGFAQFALFPTAIKRFVARFNGKGNAEQNQSSYRSLCTALAATVGTGNLAGVAGAIAIGGPGAVFWMWICALLGMVVKFAEATLCVHFRVRNECGEWTGGPMYMIQNGLPKRLRFLGAVYCFFGVVAAFGVGNATQINTVVNSVNGVISSFCGTPSVTGNLIIGVILAVLVGSVLLGGSERIGAIAEALVPFAAVLYLILGIGVLVARGSAIAHAFSEICKGAFYPNAVTGGLVGSAFAAVRVGASRGVFTNEAGMGTAGIAHSSAHVIHPVHQGLMGIVEVFLDTIVICTMTALVILCSGVPIPYGADVGVALTEQAFTSVYGSWIRFPLCLVVCCLAVATVFGWGLYGNRCAEFLFGCKAQKRFAVLQTAAIVLSSVLKTDTVWSLAELVNGLMAIPNLIAILWLSPILIQLTKSFYKQVGKKSAIGGTYENFHQCQSVRTVSYEKVPSIGAESKKERQKDLSFEYWTAGPGDT